MKNHEYLPGKALVLIVFCAIFVLKCYSQAPTVTSFASTLTPNTSAGTGSTVTINGTNFTGATAVSFGGTAAASFTVVTSVKITAVVASGTSGNVAVTTPAGTGSLPGFYYLPLTGVTTDYGGFWSSTLSSVNSTQTNSSHSLLAFTYNSVTYSTGVNNSTLTSNAVSFTAGNFKALPVGGVAGNTPASGSTYIILAKNIDGDASTANISTVSGLTLKSVFVDGTNGLNLGTGVTNLPTTATLNFDINNIVASKINDAEPDIIITQIAAPAAGNDVFQFVDGGGIAVGNSMTQDMTKLPILGGYLADQFNLAPNTPYNTATIYSANLSNQPKDLRLVAFKLSDFGITTGNAASVKGLKITPSGNSDYAFIAYNANAFNLPPSISQNPSATNTSVCSAGVATMSVIAGAAAGGSLTFQWQRSTDGGINWTNVTDGTGVIGSTTNQLSVTSPSTNDQYRDSVTESGSGLTNISAVFNITIVSPTAPTAVNTSGTTSVCINNNTIITSNVSGGSNLYYQWQSNSSGSYVDIAGANLNNYEPEVNVAGTISYKVRVSSGSGCTAITSSAAIITVNAATVGGSISGSATVCSGTNSTVLTLSANTGTITKWQSSTDNFSTVINDITNTTTTLTATNLTATTQYRAIVQSGACASANSATATVTVIPVSAGGSIAGSTSVCTGTNSTTLTLTGKTGTVIKWQSSTDNFVSVITDVVNTTSSLTATNLTVTSQYRAVVQSGPCSSANSSTATITVNQSSVGGSVAGSASVCTGTNSTTLTLTGNTGAILKWQSSTDNFVSVINDLVNTTASLTATNLTATTQYRAVVQSGACASANSATATVTVIPVSAGGSIAGSTSVCTGTNSTTLTLTGKTGTVIKWQSSTDNFVSVITDVVNTTSSLTATNLTATSQYRAVVQSGPCSSANSSTATITVNQSSVGGSVAGSASVCTGTNSTTLTLTGNTGAILKWQSSTDNFVSVINDLVNTTASLTATNLTATTQYRAVVQSGACTASLSSLATISIVSSGTWIGGLSGNWDVATNWCGGIPSASADVVIPSNTTISIQSSDVAVHSLTISSNAGFIMQGGYTLTIAAGGNLINNGSFDASASTGMVSFAGNGTISGTTTFKNIDTRGALNFGTASTISGNFTIQTGGSVTGNAPLYTCPSSALIYNTGGTFTRGMEWLPVSAGQGYPSNVIIQNNTTINFPAEGDGYICNDLTIDAGSSLFQNYSAASAALFVERNVTIKGLLSLGAEPGGDISVGGNWTRYPGGEFENNQRTVNFTGSGNTIINSPASAFRDIHGAFGGETFRDLVIAKTVPSATVSLGAPVSVTNEIKLSQGIFDLVNSDVTIASNAFSTAHIAPLPTVSGIISGVEIRYGGPTDTGTGKFVVQRYLDIGTSPTSRRWRLLTLPFAVSNAPTISTAWQEGVSNSDRNAPVDPWPGFGTTITKSNVYNPADGYDQGSTNNPSLYYFSGTGWAVLPTTNTDPITDHEAYMLFARGNRSIVVSSPNINANSTTLEPKGRLSTGDVEKSLVTGFQPVGNPYASAINFNKASFNNYSIGGTTYNTTPGSTAGEGITYYIWDPETSGTNGVGQFITCSSNGDGTYLVTTNDGGVPTDGTIPSGTAFMIASDNGNGTLTLHEADKLNSYGEIVNRPVKSAESASTFISNLYTRTGTEKKLADAVINSYADYNDGVDGLDAAKLSTFNTKEALSIIRDGALLSIERRSRITSNDTIFLAIKNLKTATYEFRFKALNFNSSLSAILEDKFTGVLTPLSIMDSTNVDFNITGDPNSYAVDRFKVIFSPLEVLPKIIMEVNAFQKQDNIAVQWTAGNQSDVIKYKVEKSTNGINFATVNTIDKTDNGPTVKNYNWLDVNAAAGKNFYRIQYCNANGTFAYSKIVKVVIKDPKSLIKIYPNPVTDGYIILQFNNIEAGQYHVRIISATGKIVSQSVITIQGGSVTQTLKRKNLISGSYQLEVTGEGKKTRSIRLLIQSK